MALLWQYWVMLRGLYSIAGIAVCRNVFLQPRKHGAAGLVSVHRLAIFDADGNVVNIISQLDILRHALCLLLAVPNVA